MGLFRPEFFELNKDPFDRMLIAQAHSEGLVVVTNEEKIAQYGIRVLDARK